jgi:ABC-type lipoprotein export system ATPase subunit
MGIPLLNDAVDASAARVGAAVEIAGLRHCYGDLPVLNGVDLRIAAGTYVAVMGRSGAGKSTLLSLIGGLEPVQAGTIRIDGEQLEVMRGTTLAAYRRHKVGFIFQHFGLLDALSALENVELALSMGDRSRPERHRRALDLLDQVGMVDRSSHRPAALSGGERQRVAIARALANEPRLLLADEPTGNLDDETAVQILDALDRARADAGCTLVVVTHERAVAARADRRLVIARGRLA